MSVYYHFNGGRGDPEFRSWIPIVILFCIPTPVTWVIAFFWLVSKLRGTSFGTGQSVKRHPYDLEKERQSRDAANREEPGGETARNTASSPYAAYTPPTRPAGQPVRESAGKKQTAKAPKGGKFQKKPSSNRKKVKHGIWRILLGATIALGCGIAAMVVFLDGISYGTLRYSLVPFVLCSFFTGGGLGLFFSGLSQKKKAEQYLGYLAYIGDNREVPLAHMAASFGVSVQKLCKDLRAMLTAGILPTGYLDLAEGRLYLTEQGYRAPQPKEEREEEVERAEQQEDAILREIRQVNDDIPDEEMSAKIDRIEEITRKILIYQRQHPDREKQLRSFLNYYLPTTLKILRAYAQLDAQGIEGENITAAKVRIEGMMDQVVAGFEKQLDKLFRDDALDIASDVEVLENMLKKDGLSGGENLTLEL